jgi:hypothetical protein
MPSTESVGWFGWLREASVPRQADRVVAVGGDADLLRAVDQVEVGHQLGDPRDHLGGQALLTRLIMSPVVVSARSHSRKSPTFQPLISRRSVSLTASSMTRVTSSSS